MHHAFPEPVPPALGVTPCAHGLVYGSVCSGIEAATAAWEPLGWQPAFFAEIEPFPSAVLAHHYPAVPNLGDMTAIDGSAWRGKIDVLVGGTPCQAFSVAGRRRSLDDARGNLALTFVDLADAIDPAWIVWENVPGVLSTRDNAFGCLLGGLAGEDGPLLPPGGRWADAGAVFGPARTVAWRVPDDYTRIPWRRKAPEGCPDGPRYRALGNSMANRSANWAEWDDELLRLELEELERAQVPSLRWASR